MNNYNALDANAKVTFAKQLFAEYVAPNVSSGSASCSACHVLFTDVCFTPTCVGVWCVLQSPSMVNLDSPTLATVTKAIAAGTVEAITPALARAQNEIFKLMNNDSYRYAHALLLS